MEQLVFLIIIGLISLVNWIMRRSAELREQRRLEGNQVGDDEQIPDTDQVERRMESSSEEPAFEMRKLMEALGLPLEEREPVITQKLPPAIPPSKLFVKRPTIISQQVPAFVRPEPTKSPAPQVTRIRGENKWTASLASRQGVRQAIVLREILGSPKAFTI